MAYMHFETEELTPITANAFEALWASIAEPDPSN